MSLVYRSGVIGTAASSCEPTIYAMRKKGMYRNNGLEDKASCRNSLMNSHYQAMELSLRCYIDALVIFIINYNIP